MWKENRYLVLPGSGGDKAHIRTSQNQVMDSKNGAKIGSISWISQNATSGQKNL